MAGGMGKGERGTKCLCMCVSVYTAGQTVVTDTWLIIRNPNVWKSLYHFEQIFGSVNYIYTKNHTYSLHTETAVCPTVLWFPTPSLLDAITNTLIDGCVTTGSTHSFWPSPIQAHRISGIQWKSLQPVNIIDPLRWSSAAEGSPEVD